MTYGCRIHAYNYAYSLLTSPQTFSIITKNIRYVLVDEYQDTNYIQDQILIKLAEEVVTSIKQKKFKVHSLPGAEVCRTCDIRYFCRKEGLL